MNYIKEINTIKDLEDLDIKKLSSRFPDLEVGVRINVIYAQIAKFRGNSSRKEEIYIFLNALSKTKKDKFRNFKYTTMTSRDAMKCFGKDLKKMPKGSFVQYKRIKE